MTRSAYKGGPPPPRGRLAPHLPRATQQAQPGKMSYTSESLPPGLGPGHTLSIVQHNCLGSWDVFLSLFNSFASAKNPPLIVCLQDPPVWRNRLPSHSGFTSFAPSATGRRPRVAFYVFRSLIDMTTITPIFTGRSDIATLEITAPSLFGTTMKRFHIINSYSVWGKTATERTIAPTLALPFSSFPTLVVGDFNIHHPSADPLRKHNSSELKASFPYFSRAAEYRYTLLNIPGVHTHFPLQGSSRSSVLDLAFASPALVPFFHEWATDLPSTGSDHVPISIRLAHPITCPPPPAPNWVRTDCPNLEPHLKETNISPPPALSTKHTFEEWFDFHLGTLIELLKTHTPACRPSVRAKPWWSPLLSTLRKEFHSSSRKARTSDDPQDRVIAKLSKQGYFKAIKAAKAHLWKSFLADATPRTIWTAKRFAVGRVAPRFPNLPDATSPEEVNQALLSHFFPPKPLPIVPSILRPYKGCDPLLPGEITAALRKCSSSSAPGPDTIPYSVWKRVHLTAPPLLTDLLGRLLKFGYHPVSMKKANGIVLDKPGKPSYDSPASFRVIVLLQTVSKILERVVASRLSLTARTLKLVHSNQCGSLPALSSFDAAISLVDTVRTLQRPGLRVSTLFLDIKGRFHNVNASTLCSSLKKAGVPPTTWYPGLALSSLRGPAACCSKDPPKPSPRPSGHSARLPHFSSTIRHICGVSTHSDPKRPIPILRR